MTIPLIDGSEGEGGGQILRTSLSWSLLTGRPFRIENIRQGRGKPGLLRQHLTAVRAAAEIADAEVTGDALGSTALTFRPRALRGGEYTFEIGTAGSTTLVLQTLLPALLRADAPSTVTITGGTHNPLAPPVPFLQRTYLPLVERMGADAKVNLVHLGFAPVGGGKIVARVTPNEDLVALHLGERGPITHRAIRVVLAAVPYHVAQREIEALCLALDWPADLATVEEVKRPNSPGNAIFVEVGTDESIEVFSGIGARGTRAEDLARDVAGEVNSYLEAGALVGPYLADQLLPLLAAGPGGSFATSALTPHAKSQITLLNSLGARPIAVTPTGEGRVRIAC
jgi:RNA 3'-terminal phosphate cyclase (ATP)